MSLTAGGAGTSSSTLGLSRTIGTSWMTANTAIEAKPTRETVSDSRIDTARFYRAATARSSQASARPLSRAILTA